MTLALKLPQYETLFFFSLPKDYRLHSLGFVKWFKSNPNNNFWKEEKENRMKMMKSLVKRIKYETLHSDWGNHLISRWFLQCNWNCWVNFSLLEMEKKEKNRKEWKQFYITFLIADLLLLYSSNFYSLFPLK